MSNKFEKITLDRIEACRRMFDGERLYLDSDGLSYAAFRPDYGFKIKSAGRLTDICGLFHLDEHDWYIKKPWYESIPECGVLCMVRDSVASSGVLRLVVGYNSERELHRFELDGCGAATYASPLTDEEIKQFLRGE